MTNIKVDGGIFILEAKNVTYKYPDGTVALDHINFKVNKGEMVSLLGKNGAGKSRTRHRSVHFRHLRPCHGADETRQR